ncbi:hypothetical protein CCUG63695_03122 [Mycobacteroides franklinii]|uniref:DUF4241 domain-containing protein n=1 Tax=Mycobacteroides franklinii TaxID=948102 RepID=A0A4R8RA39_9MYCO|nr:hypothetical protein CCUG64054_03195 [Mycobacteroides franklinii]TDZ50277.1 hypothetical protein CCUG63697_01781 [Mycobacteroides franklinii]TDZ56697.1 hypothetical protein CCUG63696_03197 [Mycobacteroides franklinii]TDZ63638.1 hypothetical protein CCUG63695_03122 [Mycobacteroides franklinii]TDZ70035.1 hypothetical protein CCUG64056_03195 [Mycobacteroides franklinii]
MSLVDPSRFAPWYCPPPLFRNIELGRIEVSSGRLAIRDVYDLHYPQVVLNVDPGNYRVWSTELNIRTKPGAPLFRPAYLSIQLSDAPRKRIDFPEDLYGKPAPPYGISVSTDLGMILVHDAESVSAKEFEALDRSWERAWESDRDYSDVYTSAGATVITCKTVIDKSRHPIVASYDAKNLPVGIHVDFGVLDASQATLHNSRGRVRRWGAAAGRMFRRR